MGGVASEAAVGVASRPRLERATLAFAAPSADQAVSVFVVRHLGDGFARLVVNDNTAAVVVRSQMHQLFAVGLIGRDTALAAYYRPRRVAQSERGRRSA